LTGAINPTAQALLDRGITLPKKPICLKRVFERAGVHSVFIIAMTGRCGSTWLAKTLGQVEGVCEPEEYFSNEAVKYYGTTPEDGDLEDFILSIVKKYQKNGNFGFKIDGQRLSWLDTLFDLESSFTGEDVKWIDMRRINIVKQALSFARAKKSNTWHIFSHQDAVALADSTPEEITDKTIWNELNAIVRSENLLNSFYEKLQIDPLFIKYEELIDSKHQVLCRVLHHIADGQPEILFQSIEDKTKKISSMDQDNREIRFCQDNIAEISKVYKSRR